MTIGVTYYRTENNIFQNLVARLRFKKEVMNLTLKHGIEGFTLLKALGAWKGKTEPSYQLLLEGVPEATVRALAEDFRDSFRQEAVMVKSGNKVRFI